MSGFRRPEQPREQMVLWAQRLDDAIPVCHPVRPSSRTPKRMRTDALPVKNFGFCVEARTVRSGGLRIVPSMVDVRYVRPAPMRRRVVGTRPKVAW